MKKIKLKTIGLWLGFSSILTTLILTSGILSNTSIINTAGSSAVQPLMVEFSNEYTSADIVTQAGGSGAGIRAVIDETKEIGMASKWPNIIGGKNKSDEQKWIDNKIKTITIAWDGMGIIYKPANKNTKKIDINTKTIKEIYVAFAGNKQVKFSEIGIPEDETYIWPFARSGGSLVSGTADAFYKDSHLEYEEDKLLDKALIDGQYGEFTTTTAESNSQAWSFIKNENKIGSMIYLSAGFIINNKEEILNNGFEIATYNGVELKLSTIAQQYNWYRPLNLMMSIKNIEIRKTPSGQLIEWILNFPTAEEIITNGGYIKLTEKEIKELMCLNNDLSTFWTTDDKEYYDEYKGNKS